MKYIVPESYYEDEVRDGFYVSSVMKKAWAVGLKGYYDLIEACENNGLSCWVSWGTMLGAVRGGGYIPWDDDIDVEMFREDYDCLKKLADNSSVPGGYFIMDYVNSGGRNLARKWSNSSDVILPHRLWQDNYGFPFLNSIDIFINDDVPTNEDENRVYRDVISEISALQEQVLIRMSEADSAASEEEEKYQEQISALEERLGCRFDQSKPMLAQVLGQYDSFICRYNAEDRTHCAMVSYYMNEPNMLIPKKLYAGFIDMPYETGFVRVPIGYDGILRRYFGNYMYPERMFSGHEYPFYVAFEQAARKNLGIEFMHYHLYPEQIRKDVEEKYDEPTLVERIDLFLDTVREAHDYIRNQLEAGSTGASGDLLLQCQELAINIGEYIERKAKEPGSIIRLLEEYCESVFRLHEKVIGFEKSFCEEMTGLIDVLEDLIIKLNKLSEAGVETKQEVLFLSMHVDSWWTMHELWKRYSENDDMVVRVIPVPYYRRDVTGLIKPEDIIIETDGYPDEVELTGYDEYDFEGKYVDIAFVQNPFDDYSDAISVHPFFYTKNLCRYVKEMVLIPGFRLQEIVPEDQRARIMLKNYIQTPGMVYADCILTQSVEMREVFLELLNRFVDDELGYDIPDDLEWVFDWENKVISMEVFLPSSDDQRGCDIKKDDDSCMIAYYVSGSQLYESGIQGVEKMKKVVDVLLEEGIKVFFVQDVYVEQILKQYTPEVWEEYVKAVTSFKHREGVCFEEKYDEESAVRYADAIYGDGGTLMNRCRMCGKPVLFASPWIHDFEEPEGYERKRWNERILVAEEGDWSLHNFVDEVRNIGK